MAKKHINWLFQEIPNWVKSGIIEEEQGQRILSQYSATQEENTSESWNPGIIALSVLGALLIGGGLMLILGYQWDKLSLFAKKILSFVPAILGLSVFVFAYVRHLKSMAWREGASGFFMIMIAASLGMVNQIFELHISNSNIILYWLVSSLAVVYIPNSSLAAIIYLIGAAFWQVDVIRDEKMIYWLLFLAIIPHLWLNWRLPIQQPIRRHLLALVIILTWPIVWFPNFMTGFPEYTLLAPSIALCVFILLNNWVFPNDQRFFRRPFFLMGFIGVFVYTLALSGRTYVQPFNFTELWNGTKNDQYGGWFFLLQLAVFTLGWLGLLILYFGKKHHRTIGETLLVIFPIFVLAYMTIYRLNPSDAYSKPVYINYIPVILANLYGLAVGAAFIRQGIAKPSLVELNLGMLFVLGLTAARFFDSNWNEFYKGLAFVVLGVVFLFVNLRMSKRLVKS